MSVLIDVFTRMKSLDRKSTNMERVLFTEDFTFEAFDAALSELELKSSA